MIRLNKIEDSTYDKKEYPKIMISKMGWVVLFTDYEVGVLIGFEKQDSKHCDIGLFCDDWNMDLFEYTNKEFVLKNVQ